MANMASVLFEGNRFIVCRNHLDGITDFCCQGLKNIFPKAASGFLAHLVYSCSVPLGLYGWTYLNANS